MSVRVSVDSRDARQKLDQLADSLTPTVFSRFFEGEIENYFQMRMAQRFLRGGDDASGKWAPLSDETLRTKSDKSQSVLINVASTEMREFLMSGTFDARGNGGDVEFVYPRETPSSEVDLRINVAETGRQGKQSRNARGQFGKKRSSQPARPVLAVTTTDLEMITNSLYTSIERYVT